MDEITIRGQESPAQREIGISTTSANTNPATRHDRMSFARGQRR
jgi:hypothetical protein